MAIRYDVATLAHQFRSPEYPDGVSYASWLGALCDLSSPATYTSIFAGKNKNGEPLDRIGIITMDRLCVGLDCAAGDFLIAHPERMPAEGARLRRARKKLGLTTAAFAARLDRLTGFFVSEEILAAWEDGRWKIREGIWQAVAEMALAAPRPKPAKPNQKAGARRKSR